MPVTFNPMPTPSPTSTTTKLVADSGLKLPTQASVPIIPVAPVTEKISLRSSAPALSDAEQAELNSLKARDNKLRQHEQAHVAASAGLNVSKAAFTYQRGPDGVQYAVAGDVRIDASPGNNAKDSLARGELIVDVALAPADPTPGDRSVAAVGRNMAQQASAELARDAEKLRQEYLSKDAGQKNTVQQAYADENSPPKKIDTFV
jgi:SprA-related family